MAPITPQGAAPRGGVPQQRVVAGAVFYTHVTSIVGTGVRATSPPHAAAPTAVSVENTSWEERLRPLTLPAIVYTRSVDIPHPADPRRARQLKREREEFSNHWITGNIDIRTPGRDSESRVPASGDRSTRNANMKFEGFQPSRQAHHHSRRNSEANTAPDTLDTTLAIAPKATDVTSPQNPRSVGKSSLELQFPKTWTVDMRSHVNEDTVECEESSLQKSVQEDTADVGGEKLPPASAASESSNESDPTQTAMRCDKTEVSSIATITIPELLDEDVGNRISSFLVKIPRTAITLHLNTHGAVDAKKDLPQIRPVPEIRIADSSVPDEEGPAQDSAEKCICKRDRSEDTSASKRPRIIEDLTCVEGLIFDRSSLSNFSKPLAESRLAKKPKGDEVIEEEIVSVTTNAFEYKSENMDIEATKRWRVRRKFRQLFGKTLTPSEIEEENELMDETIPKKRRKESRMSLDSGVCLSEGASERVSASPDVDFREKRPESLERRFPAVKDEVTSIECEEKSCDFDPLVRSMPLLDSTSPEKFNKNVNSKTLPDSSTNFEDKPEINLDGLSGKLKILISPIDTQGADTFTPMSLEIDLSSGSQISMATSTTQFPSETNTPTPKEKSENYDDLSKLLEMDLKRDCHITQQGNTISIQEEADARIIPPDDLTAEKDVEIESRVADNAINVAEDSGVTSQTKCEENAAEKIISDDSPVELKDLDVKMISSATEACNNEDKLNPKDSDQRTLISSATDDINPQTLTKSVDSVPEIEEIAIKKELPEVVEIADSEEQQSAVDDTPTAKESTEIEEPRSTSSAELANTEGKKSPPNPMPRLRVLHHSELGSRWCPTPMNGNVSSIYEPEKLAQPPVSPISTIPPYLQSAVTADHPQPESQLQCLHLLVLNAAPVIASNPPDSYSKDSPNGYNIPETPPVYLPPEYPVRQGAASSKNAPTPTAMNVPPNSPNSSVPATDSFIPQSSMLANIFEYLLALQWCVERCQFMPGVYDPAKLRKDFHTKKSLLCLELQKYCTIMGTYDLKYVVRYIVQYYEQLMRPEERILNLERVMYILKLKDLPLPNYGRQGQMQSGPAAPNATYYSPPATSKAPAPRRPQTSQNSTLYAAQQGQRRFATSQFDFSALRPMPTVAATVVRSTRSLLSPKQMNIFYDQVMTYNYIDTTLRQQLAALYQNQEAERQRILREQPKEISLQDKLKRTMNRRKDQWPVPVEENITNGQTELRQSPVATTQQEVIASQRRGAYSNSTFVPPMVDNAGAQLELRHTYAQQITPRGTISGTTSKIPISTDINSRQELRWSPATTTQKFIAQDPILGDKYPKIPVSVENINTRQERRQSPATSRSTPVPMDNIGAQLELRQSPASSVQKLTSEDPILCGNLRSTPVPLDNPDAQLELRQSPAASSQKLTAQDSMLYEIIRGNSVLMDNTGAQLELRQSPATSAQKLTSQDSIHCGTSRSTPVPMENIGAQSELRRSPASNQQSALRELLLSNNRTNIADTMDNTDGGQLELRRSPAATVKQITSREPIRNNRRNIPVSVDNTDAQLELRQSPATLIQEVTARESVLCNSTNIVNSTDQDDIVELPREQSPAAQIHEKLASGNPKIIKKLSGNRCNVRVVDVLEEFDALSPIPSEKRPRASDSHSPVPSPRTESLPFAAKIIPMDVIATTETDKTEIQGSDEENNNCASFHRDDESTDSATSPVPVITINDDDHDDDDDLEVRPIENSKTLTESEAAEMATEAENEITDGSADTARKDEKGTIDGTSCESDETAKVIEDEPTEIFSILDVKSISKDVFNNMGNSGEIEPPLPPRIQGPMEIDGVDIKGETLPNCFRCGKPSSVVCEQCCLAFYCSTACHQEHWVEIHHLSCKPVPEETLAQL